MWFTGYLILELGLAVFLRHIGTELIVHHFVFGIISVIVLYRGGLTGIVGALLAQELSSPALNVFMFVRGFYGADGAARIWLIIFIVIFIPVRLVLAGVCSAGFVASWLNPAWSASKPWTPAYAAWEQVVLVVGVGAGMAMQLVWARTIINRVLKPWMKGQTLEENDAEAGDASGDKESPLREDYTLAEEEEEEFH
jgi:hypothetical protein